VIHERIASGGAAAVHFGRWCGPGGFARTVAIKRLLPTLAADRKLVTMLIDEARLLARIHHPNVGSIIDVIAHERELLLVMEYIDGETFSRLILAAREGGAPIPPAIVSAIVCGVLQGLHAAHVATDEHGSPLCLVHRDVSPQNVMVGVDGIARLVDFGIAKATGRIESTREGQVKGKLRYMPPEQLRGAPLDGRTDVYAAGVMLWEALTGYSLFQAATDEATIEKIFITTPDAPSRVAPGVPRAVDEIALRALAKNPAERFASAREMAVALEEAIPMASVSEVGAWVARAASEALSVRAAIKARLDAEEVSCLTEYPHGEPAVIEIAAPARAPQRQTLARRRRSAAASVPMSPRPSPAAGRRLLLSLAALGVALLAWPFMRFVAQSDRPMSRPAAGDALARLADRPAVAQGGSDQPARDDEGASVDGEPSTDSTRTPASPADRAREGRGASRPARGAGQRSSDGLPRCQPAYVVDEDGMHHIKPECL
jgi:serine/threonine-protein kinase